MHPAEAIRKTAACPPSIQPAGVLGAVKAEPDGGRSRGQP